MCSNTESLCCAPGTVIVFGVNYASIEKQKQTKDTVCWALTRVFNSVGLWWGPATCLSKEQGPRRPDAVCAAPGATCGGPGSFLPSLVHVSPSPCTRRAGRLSASQTRSALSPVRPGTPGSVCIFACPPHFHDAGLSSGVTVVWRSPTQPTF